ncbi:MAG TPA: hypothetical protein VES91_03625 [Burkholderiaceae bacterium]|nr:hypothetical protein [Burkholderiaceae bacterium]
MSDMATKSPLDTTLNVMQLDPTALLDADARKAFEHMRWIAAQGTAARILGALADGVTPTAASQSTGVMMAPSPLANMCEFVTLTNAGLDPAIGRERVGELRTDDAASAVELWAKEQNRIRGLARILYAGQKLDYLWFAKLAAYNPEATRTELHAAISKWAGISFARIHSARKLIPTLAGTAPLREAGQIAGYLLAGEVPQLATLEPVDIFLETGGYVQPAEKNEATQPEHEDLEKFALTRLGGFAAERLVGEIPRDAALVRAARDIAQFDGLQMEMFGNMQPQQVFEMYERYVAECLKPHEDGIRAIAAKLEKLGRLESADLFALGVRFNLLPIGPTVEGAPA